MAAITAHRSEPLMPYTPDWHALEDTHERAWLDQWTRGLIDTHTLEPATPAVPVLAGSHQ